MLGKMQKTANKANSSRVTPIRIEKRTVQCVSIPNYLSVNSLEEDYGSTESEDMSMSPDTSCRSSADADKSFDLDEDFRKKLTKFDDIIETIKNLRFEREDDNDDKDANENIGGTRGVSSKNVDNVEYQVTCKSSQMIRHIDNEDINNNEDNVMTDNNEHRLPLNIHNELDDKEQCCSLDDQNSTDDGDSESDQERRQEHEDSDNSDLIERGPIKPTDYQPVREHPYSMMSWLSRVNDSADVLHAVDYDKTAEQIMRNKDYSEKLNPCLDQLSNSSRNQSEIDAISDSLTMIPSWTGENGEGAFRHGELNNDVSKYIFTVYFNYCISIILKYEN